MAQEVIFMSQGRSAALAGSACMLSGSGTGSINPAGISTCSDIQFGLHARKTVWMDGMNLGAAEICIPTSSGNFELAGAAFGNAFYHESLVSLAYGKRLGQKVRAGICLHYLYVGQPPGFGNLHSIFPTLGLQVLPVKQLVMGLLIRNPARQEFLPQGHVSLNTVLQAGIGWSLGESTLVCAEVETSTVTPTQYRGGIECDLTKMFCLRFGIFSGPYPGYTLGISYHRPGLVLNMAAIYHPVLGYSPSVSLLFIQPKSRHIN